MYKFSSIVVIVCGLLLLVIQSTVAQSSQKIVFTCFYWQGLPKEPLFYRNGKDFLPLEFSLAQRSPEKELAGMEWFEIYRRIDNPKEDELPYELVGKSTIPRAKKVLFVVIPEAKEEKVTQTYEVHGMDDSLLTFPSGSFQFVNFTAETLTVLCGSKSVQLPAKGANQIKDDKARGGFSFFAVYDKSQRKIASTRLFGQPRGRELVFIIPPTSSTSQARLKFVSEIIHPKPDPTTAGE